MKLGVHRPDSGTYALRPSPATCLHLRHIRAFGVPSTGDEHDPPEPYVTFTLLEADPMAPQPSARTEALSHADQCDPVWHDDLRLMLAAGTVRPPLVRVEMRQASCRSSARAKSPPSSGPTLWADRAAASASCSDSGEAAQQADALLGSAAVRLADAGRGKVVDLQLAGEGKFPSFRIAFAYDMCRALPRRLTLRNVAGFGVPEAARIRGSHGRQQSKQRVEPFVRFSLVTDEGGLVTSLVGAAAAAADVSLTGLEPRTIRPQTSGLADPMGAAAVPNQEAGTGADTEACLSMVEGDPVWRRELELIVPAELEGSALRLRAQLMTRDLGDGSQVSSSTRVREWVERHRPLRQARCSSSSLTQLLLTGRRGAEQRTRDSRGGGGARQGLAAAAVRRGQGARQPPL